MKEQLTLDDYITTLCQLKCFTMSQVKEYAKTHAKPVLAMINKNLELTEKLENALDIENLTEEQRRLLKAITIAEIGFIIELDKITEKTNEE